MIRYALAFAAGFCSAKFVTQKNVDAFKQAAIKSYVVIKDEFTGKKQTPEKSS